ncbi:MAG: Zn-dependent hydrolase [Woeseiaceae bacterium]|nr:Zn-dependent hydrolase [Woeseiaceae bacterium]
MSYKNSRSIARWTLTAVTALVLAACAEEPERDYAPGWTKVDPRPEIYANFVLTADLSGLSDNQREMVAILIEASEIMDDLFWRQAWADDWQTRLEAIEDDDAYVFAQFNYGPWDRQDNDQPFIDGVGPKPLGANFYPADMTVEEYEATFLPGDPLYTLIRRDEAGALTVVPYSVAYADELGRAADLLREAADLAEDPAFATYLKLRAAALISDEYQISDLQWMDVRDNDIDLVIGPIETYEDRLIGARAAFESFVLIKDTEWSDRLSRFAEFLPELQEGLPVPEEYKAETPGTDSDLNAYDVVYYAGDSNAGAKTIAINLPNDEAVQDAKGSRRLMLRNAMQAKFEQILLPIADELMDESQRQHITFDAFFSNTMYHEVAHGLGIRNTLDGRSTVSDALRETSSAIEEGKADILGLYMITQLHQAGELGDVDLRDFYVTFMAGIFRSTRFGASSAHGRANMVCFNFFEEYGAFVRDPDTGRYSVDFEAMDAAMTELSRVILTLQGDGNYEGAVELLDTRGVIGPQLQADLDRLTEANIPVDIVFTQGVDVLSLE